MNQMAAASAAVAGPQRLPAFKISRSTLAAIHKAASRIARQPRKNRTFPGHAGHSISDSQTAAIKAAPARLTWHTRPVQPIKFLFPQLHRIATNRQILFFAVSATIAEPRTGPGHLFDGTPLTGRAVSLPVLRKHKIILPAKNRQRKKRNLRRQDRGEGIRGTTLLIPLWGHLGCQITVATRAAHRRLLGSGCAGCSAAGLPLSPARLGRFSGTGFLIAFRMYEGIISQRCSLSIGFSTQIFHFAPYIAKPPSCRKRPPH